MINNLTLRDLASRTIPPSPWTEGDNIPWNDPAFSERMLCEHAGPRPVELAYAALAEGGELVLEVQTEEQIRSAEDAAPTWYTAEGGLFADGPHLVLHERFWDEEQRCSTERWHVIDEAGGVTRYALSNEAYSAAELVALLEGAGFDEVRILDRFGGAPEDSPMFGVRATRGGAATTSRA